MRTASVDPKRPLPWTHHEHWWGKVAKWSGGDLSARVVDKDGDLSIWEVRQDGTVLAKGEIRYGDHFRAAIAAAEAHVADFNRWGCLRRASGYPGR
jgi:hypothetical protein